MIRDLSLRTFYPYQLSVETLNLYLGFLYQVNHLSGLQASLDKLSTLLEEYCSSDYSSEN